MNELRALLKGKYTFAKLSVLLLTLFVLLLQSSCKKDEPDYVRQKYNPELIPTISTDSVTQKISDSGRVKYKVVAKRMQVFDKAKDPHWYFPKGVYLEEYDSGFHVCATIVADTVWNFTKRNTWRLKGHVKITNINGSVFKTEELFWNQMQKKIYTDKFIQINTPERDLKGYGMDASQDLSTYKIRRPTGVLRMKKGEL